MPPIEKWRQVFWDRRASDKSGIPLGQALDTARPLPQVLPQIPAYLRHLY